MYIIRIRIIDNIVTNYAAVIIGMFIFVDNLLCFLVCVLSYHHLKSVSVCK